MNKETLMQMVENGNLIQLHTSYFKGYVSRKTTGYVEPYSGRFGEGYVLKEPCWKSTTYSYITYYIKAHV